MKRQNSGNSPKTIYLRCNKSSSKSSLFERIKVITEKQKGNNKLRVMPSVVFPFQNRNTHEGPINFEKFLALRLSCLKMDLSINTGEQSVAYVIVLVFFNEKILCL